MIDLVVHGSERFSTMPVRLASWARVVRALRGCTLGLGAACVRSGPSSGRGRSSAGLAASPRRLRGPGGWISRVGVRAGLSRTQETPEVEIRRRYVRRQVRQRAAPVGLSSATSGRLPRHCAIGRLRHHELLKAARGDDQPAPPIWAMALFISLSLTSLTWVITDHSLPKGSSNRALRSP